MSEGVRVGATEEIELTSVTVLKGMYGKNKYDLYKQVWLYVKGK